ncbi:MAG: acyl-CoA thioesterase [Sutterellaceae bacterium]|nr:acyl-CoA thioesterase [Sutterellaceae bacterium]MDD7442396.1 thioesterase family protein [Sutterellaceae bacterium]MDY2867165.1 thioesterase family protein [Mesosutterella sp.]
MTQAIYEKHVTVGPESIDALGHVNNREYLRWMEEVATEHSESLGWSQERYIREKHVWVVREHWIEYLRPAVLGDELTVYTWLQEAHGSVCLRRYAVVKDGKAVLRAATEWAHIDFETKRACTPPESLSSAFPLVPPDSPELKRLGIARCVRWAPVTAGNYGETGARKAV